MGVLLSILIALVIIVLLSYIIFDHEPVDSIPVRLALNWVLLPADFYINSKLLNRPYGNSFVNRTESLINTYVNKGLLTLNNVLSQIHVHNNNPSTDKNLKSRKLLNYANSIVRLVECSARMNRIFGVTLVEPAAPIAYANIFKTFSDLKLTMNNRVQVDVSTNNIVIVMATVESMVQQKLSGPVNFRSLYNNLLNNNGINPVIASNPNVSMLNPDSNVPQQSAPSNSGPLNELTVSQSDFKNALDKVTFFESKYDKHRGFVYDRKWDESAGIYNFSVKLKKYLPDSNSYEPNYAVHYFNFVFNKENNDVRAMNIMVAWSNEKRFTGQGTVKVPATTVFKGQIPNYLSSNYIVILDDSSSYIGLGFN
jgi:hypothetical protein